MNYPYPCCLHLRNFKKCDVSYERLKYGFAECQFFFCLCFTRHLVNKEVSLSLSKSLWRLLLSRSIRSELSCLRCHGHSLLLSSYLHRISRKENSDCSACGHPLQDLNHLLLDCRASEPLRKSIFLDLWLLSLYSRSMVQTLGCGPTVGSPRSSSAPPSIGRS